MQLLSHTSLSLTLLVALTACTASQHPSGYAPDFPHEVCRIDYDKLIEDHPGHNLILDEGDVIWVSEEPMFEKPSPLEVGTGRLKAGSLWGPRPYTIKPGDQLRVAVYELRTVGHDHEQQRPVTDEGFVNLSLIGRMEAAGRTQGQFSRDIVEKLETDGKLSSAMVNIWVQHAQRTYQILGTSTRSEPNGPIPNTFLIEKERLTLREALVSKGASFDASSYIYLVRRPRPYSP